nr:hypothetical protein [Streptomyces sp. ME02-8801-2C]
MTNGVRLELAEQGTLVTAVHLGLADTDMAAGWPVAKLAPSDLADAALDGVEAGSAEVLADQWSRDVKSRLPLTPEEFNAEMGRPRLGGAHGRMRDLSGRTGFVYGAAVLSDTTASPAVRAVGTIASGVGAVEAAGVGTGDSSGGVTVPSAGAWLGASGVSVGGSSVGTSLRYVGSPEPVVAGGDGRGVAGAGVGAGVLSAGGVAGLVGAGGACGTVGEREVSDVVSRFRGRAMSAATAQTMPTPAAVRVRRRRVAVRRISSKRPGGAPR